MIDKKELQEYYDKISRGIDLVDSRANRDKAITILKQAVDEYLISDPDATIQSIYRRFGKPESIIEANTVRIPITTIDRLKSMYGKIIIWTIVAFIMMFIFFMGIKFG